MPFWTVIPGLIEAGTAVAGALGVGGGGGPCTGGPSVAEVQAVFSVLSPAEVDYLWTMYERASGKTRTYEAFIAGVTGGSDCKVKSTAGKELVAAWQEMRARASGRGSTTGTAQSPATSAPSYSPGAPVTAPGGVAVPATMQPAPVTQQPVLLEGITAVAQPTAPGARPVSSVAGAPWIDVSAGAGIKPLYLLVGLGMVVFALPMVLHGGKR